MSHTARVLTLTVVVCMLMNPSLVSSKCGGPRGCTKEYNPVCATFRKTYSNPCMLQADICNQAQQGFEYVQYSEGDCCDRGCLTVYDPVTDCNGDVHSNTCEMINTACRQKQCLYSADNRYPPLE